LYQATILKRIALTLIYVFFAAGQRDFMPPLNAPHLSGELTQPNR